MTIHALQGGGAERVFCQLCQRWADAGHDVHVITWSSIDSDPFPLVANIVRHGLDVLSASRNIWQSLLANRVRLHKLRSTLRKVNPDVVLSFCDQMNITTLGAARSLGLPVWIAERSDPSQQQLSFWWERGRRLHYPYCSGCIVQTEHIAQHLSQLIPRERIFVIPNAVNAPHTSETGSRISSEAECTRPLDDDNASPKVVLSVGRLSHEKGVDLLLAAWREIHRQLADWKLRVVGDGPLRATLESQCSDLSSVEFLGWQADPADEYSTAGLFVLPSRYEGFPNALLEAMSHGLPCIATQCSQAIDELSQAGSAVRVVAVESRTQLAAAIVELAQAAALRQQLSQAALQVSQQYSWNRIGPLWDRLLVGSGLVSGVHC